MRIELSQIIPQDARRSLGFPKVAQLLPGQTPHPVLEDLRKFLGQISTKLSHKSRPGVTAANRSAVHVEVASDLHCEKAWDTVIDRIL